jgi:transglutaminase-like putative cysteine protease
VRSLAQRYLHPREGWLSLLLLFVMMLSVGWSVQRADWLNRLDFLVPVALYAIILGALLGLSRLSVTIVLPLSALVGTGVVLWAIGGEYFTDLGQADRLLSLRTDAIHWIQVVSTTGYAVQQSPYAVGLGVLMWVTGFMAAYAIYRHHRVMDAIVLVGATLAINLWVSLSDLFGYIVLFSLAALCLWLVTALVSREEGWRLRKVTENVDVHASMVRSGVGFIAMSVALAWILTSVAVAAPLTGVWNNLDDTWNQLRDDVSGIFGGITGGQSRVTGTVFGPALAVRGSWTSADTEVMTVASKRAYYLRTITYDVYTGHGWARSAGSRRSVAAGDRIFPGYTPERPIGTTAFDLETITIQVQRSSGRNVFTPGYPTVAFLPLWVELPGGQPFLGGLESAVPLEAGKGYQITAAISRATEAQLAGAGIAYPAEIVANYLDTTGITDRTRQLAESVISADATRRGLSVDDPYHAAYALAQFLRADPSFRYATVASLPSNPTRDLVDFFLFDPEQGRAGYCEYYATAMAMMARSVGLPARVAVGYAPGERLDAGIFQYRERNAHAWAEIYFPGYGWQIFEATHSIAPVVRLSGGPVAPPVSNPGNGVNGGLGGFDETDPGDVSTLPSFQPQPGGFPSGGQKPAVETRNGNALLVAGFLSLLAVAIAWRLRRTRRQLRLLTPGDRQWQRLALAAGRAGSARSPSETIYEYAGWLEEQLPRRAPEIRQIADGKVWQNYSGRSITAEAIARLERAWGRLQLPLLWLTIRRAIGSFIPRRRA